MRIIAAGTDVTARVIAALAALGAAGSIVVQEEPAPAFAIDCAKWPPTRNLSAKERRAPWRHALPAPMHFGCDRNRGQIAALGLGRRRLLNRPLIAQTGRMLESARARQRFLKAVGAYRNRPRLAQSF